MQNKRFFRARLCAACLFLVASTMFFTACDVGFKGRIFDGDNGGGSGVIPLIITGIPARYTASFFSLRLYELGAGTGGWGHWFSNDGQVTGSSVTFYLPTNATSWANDVVLVSDRDVYRAFSRNFGDGPNTILFSSFTADGTISITVTGIPAWYNGGMIDISPPGLGNDQWNVFTSSEWENMAGGSATFTLWDFNTPGIYDIGLLLNQGGGGGIELRYLVSSRNLNRGTNTIPFSIFTSVSTTITVTGIPSRYISSLSLMNLWDPSSGNHIAEATGARITGSSATFVVVFFGSPSATTYDIVLSFHDLAVSSTSAGYLVSRSITRGSSITIPFSAFTSVW